MREMKDSGIEWIGEIPSDWNFIPLRNIIIRRDSGAWGTDYDDESGTICMRIADFDYDRGIFKDTPIENLTWRKYTTNQIKTLKLEKNDILIEKSGGGDKTPVGRAVLFDKDYTAVFANFMERLRINSNIMNPLFVEYWFRALYSCRVTPFYINQTTGIQNINLSLFLAREKIVLPSISEQSEIADFLDNKCSEIDVLLTDIKSQIDMLEQYKRSVITEAVTKGLNPDGEMKNSEIEWVGEIPKGWDVRKLKYIFSLRNERNYKPLEDVNLISLYADRGVIQHSDLKHTSGNKACNADGYKKVYKNDIVVNIILCWMGAIGRSEYNGVTSPAYDVYIPSEGVDSRFYHYYFRTSGFSGDCYKNGKGIMAMRWRTYSSEFLSIKVVVPPLDIQKEIADFLDDKCSNIDAVISDKQAQLDTLAEYKKSLIYEYVTGKKEVPHSG